eukprot:TRINITY_DN250_c0_g2_i2.p1 TRINITY_DN250_c0_g2~~TRINITY_DN250_c0_g2_i2.p1  ORF type:complete len:243 (+),score=36.84 TRINITY_DN250_c0_g2_i2:109-729(+)
MDRVQEMFNKGNYDILSSSAEFLPTNAHVPASVMKLWFRKLKDSIIPQSYYFDCLEIGKHVKSEEKLNEFVTNELPKYNQFVIAVLVDFLRELEKFHEQTKMTFTNIAMVFSPSFLRCPSERMGDIFTMNTAEKRFVELLIRKLKTDTINAEINAMEEAKRQTLPGSAPWVLAMKRVNNSSTTNLKKETKYRLRGRSSETAKAHEG